MTENNQPAVTDWHLFTRQIIVWVGHFHRLFLKVHNYVFDALKSGYKIFDHLVEFVFISPRVMDFAVTAKNCFFLGHLFGFRVLIVICRTLFFDSGKEITRRRTNTETAILAERLRLLYTELSDLLRMFNRTQELWADYFDFIFVFSFRLNVRIVLHNIFQQ